MFSDRERNIFRFSNGSKDIAADPLVVQRRLIQFPEFDAETDFKLLRLSDEKAALQAFERIVAAGRHAFQVENFKEENGVQSGLLDSEVVELLAEFGSFILEVKKNTAEAQPPPNSTESKSSTGVSSLPTTNSSSA